jgi:hypothetical protein
LNARSATGGPRQALARGGIRAVSLCVALIAALGFAATAAARWSAPAQPAGCAVALASPLVVFPSSNPTTGSGPGALLWSAPRGCAAGAAADEAVGATLVSEDLPSAARALAAGAGDLAEIAAAAGTATGQVVAVGRGHSSGALAEGRSVGAFAAARPLGGPAAPVAASNSYLGDVAIASPVRTRESSWAIAVRTQRHYGETLGPVRLVPAGPGPLAAVAVAMDYHAQILLVWASDAGVYAHEIPPSGVAAQPTQKLGSLGPGSSDPELRALLSDDGHAIVAWRSQSAAPGGGQTTTIALSVSGGALAFGAPRLLERFHDPGGFIPPAGSLRLLRLSSEAVMIAWTGVSAGHYVVRASPVSLRRGAWAPVRISGQTGGSAGGLAGSNHSRTSIAMLGDLVAGPDAEALALWRTAPPLANGAPNPRRWTIEAARGHYAGRGEVSFGSPETVAPAGRNGSPAAAVDPGTGRTVAAWVTLAGGAGVGEIAYAVRAAGPAAAAPAVASDARGAGRGAGDGWIVPALAVLLALALAAAALLGATRWPRRVRARRG